MHAGKSNSPCKERAVLLLFNISMKYRFHWHTLWIPRFRPIHVIAFNLIVYYRPCFILGVIAALLERDQSTFGVGAAADGWTLLWSIQRPGRDTSRRGRRPPPTLTTPAGHLSCTISLRHLTVSRKYGHLWVMTWAAHDQVLPISVQAALLWLKSNIGHRYGMVLF